MKPLQVLLLALVAGAAVWYATRDGSPESAQNEKLYPTLAQTLNSVTGVSVSNAQGGKVNIVRKDGIWVVKEKFRYPAHASRVGELVLAFADARPVEQKTANPEYYERLGLRDIGNAESGATLLTLEMSDKQLNLLAGNASDRFGGSTFVRKADSAQAYLVTPAITATANVHEWLDPGLLDIAADEIQSIKVTGAGSQITEINKAAMFDAEFDLVGRTDGQVLNDVAVRNLAQSLTSLGFDDVQKGVAFPFNSYKRLLVTYSLFSGVVLDVTLFYKDDPSGSEASDGPPPQAQHFLNVGARFDESLARQFVPQPDSSDVSGGGNRLELTSADISDRRAEAERINSTRKRWVYKISGAQFERMNQSNATLLNAE